MASLSKLFQFIFNQMSQSYNPRIAETTLVWANPRSLATTWGITFVFSSSGYLDVSVPRVCPPINGVPRSLAVGCPIRIFTDQRLFAPHRDFSQLITSFIASESLGIHHAPLICFLKLSYYFYFSSLFSRLFFSMSKILLT